jgi:hypothetical protein
LDSQANSNGKGISHLAIPGWRSAWVNWHNSWQDCNLSSSSPVKNELVVDFPTPQEDMSCEELEDHAKALYGCNVLSHEEVLKAEE